MAVFQFYLQSRKQNKVRWARNYSHIDFGKNSLVKRKCETVRCFDITDSSYVAKFRGEVFAQFHTVAEKVTVVRGICYFVCQGEFFVKDSLDVKNYQHGPDFVLLLSRLFSISVSLDFRVRPMLFFSERLPNH
jgi:hypothetical protein